MGLNLTKNQENLAGKPKVEAQKAEAPATPEVAPEVKVEATENLGILRDKLAFVQLLGDPSRQDVRTSAGKNGEETKSKVFPVTVGARFKALADLKVPDCGIDSRFKQDSMNFVNAMNWKDVKAGEFVDLTPYEIGLMLTQVEFNGGCDGGDTPVSVSIQIKNATDKTGKVVTVAGAGLGKTPTVALRPANGAGSLKEMGFINVLDCVKEKDPNTGKQVVKSMKIVPGFEKWSPLCERAPKRASVASGRTVESKDPRKVANTKCAMFRNFAMAAAKRQQQAK